MSLKFETLFCLHACNSNIASAQRIGLIKRIKHLLPVHARITLANCLVVPLFDYTDFVWGDKDNLVLMNQLQIMHNKLAKVILDWQPRSSATEALRTLNWHPLVVRRQFHLKYISDVHSYNTRNKQNLYLQKVNRNYGKHTFTCRGATDWNMLPTDVRNAKVCTLELLS